MLRYDDVRRAEDPEQDILDFFESAYVIAPTRPAGIAPGSNLSPGAHEADEATEETMTTSQRPQCTHLDQIRDVEPSAEGCEDCLKSGASWVHLRICLICGHVGCCDSSKNKHATKHYHDSNHSIVQSFEPGEDWRWCYADQTFL